jgi:hypothetical protein
MIWKLEHKQGDVISGAQMDYGTYPDTLWTRWGYEAGPGCKMSNTHQIKIGEKINGSGSAHFGGAKTWPYVELQVEFPAGREGLAKLLADELRDFVDRFLLLNELDSENPDDEG